MTLALIVWLVMTVFPAITIAGVIALCVAGVLAFGSAIAFVEDAEEFLVFARKCVFPLAAILIVSGLVPSEKTAWYMVGAYTTQTIAQSETGQKLASDGVDVLQSLMKKAKEQIDGYDSKDVKKESK